MNQETLKATISAVVVVVVNVCAALGLSVDGDALTNVLSAAVLLASTAWGVWHNHNFTDAAQEAQKTLEELKALK